MALTVAELQVRIGADTSEAERGMLSVSQRLGSFGAVAARTGAMLTAGVTLPVVGAGVAALRTGADFESAFAGVRKTVDATEGELAELRQGIRDMAASELPATTTEIAGVAEAAGQLGIQTENILGFTRVMIDLGQATNLSGDQAATALARLANITQMPQTEFDRLGSAVVALGNNLATTEAEIVEMSLRIAGAGSQIGLTEAEILGFAGALSSVGIEAQAGGTAISRVMIDMAQAVADGGEKLGRFAGVAGMSAEEFATAFKTDAAGAVIAFVEGLGQMSAGGENVFAVLDELSLGEIRVRDALLRASGAGDLFRNSIALGSDAWRENTALADEAAQRYGTVESRFAIVRNRATDLAISLYDRLRPGVVDLLDRGGQLIGWIEELMGGLGAVDPAILSAALAFGAIVVAAGPVLAIVGALAAAFAFVASPIGLIVLATAALAAAWTSNFLGIRDVTAQAFEGIRAIIERVLGVVVPFATRMLGIITTWVDENWPLIQQTIDVVMGAIQERIASVLGAIAEFWEDHGRRIMAFAELIWTIVTVAIETALRTVLDIVRVAMQLITGDWEGAWETMAGIVERIWGAIQAIVEAVLTFIWRHLLQPALAEIQSAWDTAWNGVNSTFTGTWNAMTETARGGVNAIIGFINRLISNWNALEFSIPGFSVELPSVEVPGVGTIGGGHLGWDGLTISTPDLSSIPELATGGIITRPTLALLGEAGPEAVVPLSQMGNVYITVEGSVVTVRDLARDIRDELLKTSRRNVYAGIV